jgi:ribose 1,5-bisphosphokinase PhnN
LHISHGGGSGVEYITHPLSTTPPRTVESGGKRLSDTCTRHAQPGLRTCRVGGAGAARPGQAGQVCFVKVTQRCGEGGAGSGTVAPGWRLSIVTWGTQQQVKRDLRSGSWAMHTGSRHHHSSPSARRLIQTLMCLTIRPRHVLSRARSGGARARAWSEQSRARRSGCAIEHATATAV